MIVNYISQKLLPNDFSVNKSNRNHLDHNGK